MTPLAAFKRLVWPSVLFFSSSVILLSEYAILVAPIAGILFAWLIVTVIQVAKHMA